MHPVITSSVSLHYENLAHLVLQRADLHPEKPAYIFLSNGETEEPALSYGGLLQQARVVATLLQDRGIKEEPVILAYESGLDFIVAFWGCILSGNIAVPVYPPRGEQRAKGLDAVIANSGASLALTHRPYLTTLSRVLDQFSALRATTWLRTDVDHGVNATAASWQYKHPTAVLQYTSGSTGNPKGVQITHANVLSNQAAMQEAFDHDENTVVINCLPHYHDMGLFGNLLQPFYVGGLCVSMSPADFVRNPSRLLNAISRFQGGSCGGPNFVYGLCTDNLRESVPELDLRSWKTAFVGAERIRPEVLQRFTKKFEPYGFRREAFRPCYGLAEATLLVSMDSRNTWKADDERRSHETGSTRSVVSCGIAFGRQSFQIVDATTRQVCPEGQEGEVWIEGANVAQGYWRNATASNAVFGAFTMDGKGPFLRTGDCGYTINGELYISGRLAGFIVIDGENFHAEDLEIAAEGAHPAIEGRRCIAIPDEIDGAEDFVLVAEVARAYVRNFDAKSPGDAIYKKLGGLGSLVPRKIVFVKPGGVPSTPNGKTSRGLGSPALLMSQMPILGEWHRPAPSARFGQFVRDDSDMPISDWLTSMIAHRLSVDQAQVPLDQTFASLGIESLALIELAEQLSARLEREIDPTVMWEFPTIGELTAYLSA